MDDQGHGLSRNQETRRGRRRLEATVKKQGKLRRVQRNGWGMFHSVPLTKDGKHMVNMETFVFYIKGSFNLYFIWGLNGKKRKCHSFLTGMNIRTL